MAAELAGGAIGELRPACSASTGRNTTAILTAPAAGPRRQAAPSIAEACPTDATLTRSAA
jgi:hypothetical protein